jgi:hypothetical protein
MKKTIRHLAVVLLMNWAGVASAAEIDLNAILGASSQAASAVDQNKSNSLWEVASPVLRQAVTRESFLKGILQSRQPLGNATSRAWTGINRHIVTAGKQIPAGNYISVQFSTTFANGTTQHELVSLRLDDDMVWRFTGYTLESASASSTAANSRGPQTASPPAAR